MQRGRKPAYREKSQAPGIVVAPNFPIPSGSASDARARTVLRSG